MRPALFFLKKIFIFAVSMCVFGIVLAPSCAVAEQNSKNLTRLNQTNRTAITVIESVLAGTNVPVMNTLSGPVGATGAGLTMVPTRTAGTSASLPSVPVLAIADGSATKDQILQNAKTNIMGQANTVTATLKALMIGSGHKFGNFIFEQSIKPASSTSYVKVVWQLTILESGRVFYADPRITDPDPVYVSAVYTSKAVAAGLPSSWAYPDGGKLKWWLSKKDGTPMSATTIIDVVGAFDVPLMPESTVYDPDWAVNCLADTTSSTTCPAAVAGSGFTDIKTLISQSSASGATIDYMRKLEPAYVDKGDGTVQANMAISFDVRNLTHNSSCTNGTFRTAGRYGFTLKADYDRYTYYGVNKPTLLKRTTSYSFSPNQSFDLNQPTSLTVSGLGNSAINPFDSSGGLVDASTVAGVQYLAPVSQDGDTGLYQESINYNGVYRVCSSSDPYIGNLYGPTGGVDEDGNPIYGALSTVQQCGGHFWWGTDYSFGVDRATGQAWTVHWWYGSQSLITAISLDRVALPCPG